MVNFEGRDGLSNGGYDICLRDHGKMILACYHVLADIQFCDTAVFQDVVNPTC